MPVNPGVRRDPGAAALDLARVQSGISSRISRFRITQYQAPYTPPPPPGFVDPAVPPVPPVPPVFWRRKEPIGALILIGFGLLLLLNQMGFLAEHVFKFLWPLIFIALGVWLIVRRFDRYEREASNEPLHLDSPLEGPAILLLLGIILLLHQAGLVEFWSLFFPLLLILIGVLKLAERAALAAAGDEAPYPGSPYPYGAACNPAAAGVCTAAARHIHCSCDAGLREGSRGRAVMSSVPPEYATGRLRSAHAVAGISRAATCCMARPARCLESAAVRV